MKKIVTQNGRLQKLIGMNFVFCLILTSINILLLNNINQFYSKLTSTILKSASKAMSKTKTVCKLGVPWWNEDCKIAAKFRKHAFYRMKIKTNHVMTL